jgi:hypothetical protein
MVDPVILSVDILTQASLWQTEAERRWNESPQHVRIGEAVLVSPVDGTSRNVALSLVDGILGADNRPIKGKTLIGLYSEKGVCTGDGFTIFINRGMIAEPQELRLVLLHEITHAVDQCFVEDVHRQEAEGRLTDSADLYDLPSEQRAFTAMWTENLREDLVSGKYRNAGATINIYKVRSAEFNGFVGHCQLGREALLNQTTHHIRRIAEALQQRLAIRP